MTLLPNGMAVKCTLLIQGQLFCLSVDGGAGVGGGVGG